MQNLHSSLLQHHTAVYSLLISLFILNAKPFISLEYKDYIDIFSKAESNILLLYWLYNYKIIFKNNNKKAFKYNSLYKISFEKFEIIKKYIINNLYKGFIKSNQAPFVVPIFFIRKANGNLWFCIDFRVLNLFIWKDWYPFLLINEILNCFINIKIFIKLDIY